ncbi:MAG TPA: hypothetical protein VKI20_10480, partial [Acidimicrobiales bacterium]|nr:hypothetical protein [Acidimicrobiales bacterium]
MVVEEAGRSVVLAAGGLEVLVEGCLTGEDVVDEEADVVVRPVGVRVTRLPVALLHDPTTLLEPWRVVEVVGELGWLRVTLPE